MIPEEIVALRRRLGLNPAEFADSLGVEPRTVYRWEKGDAMPTGPALVLLAKFAEVTGDDLQILRFTVRNALPHGGLSYVIERCLTALFLLTKTGK